MARQPKEWEKIFANDATNQQGLNFQNIQTAHTAQHQKTNNPIKKWAGRNRDTDVEKKCMDTKWEKGGWDELGDWY